VQGVRRKGEKGASPAAALAFESIAFVPAVMVVMNVAYALAAYPAGVVSDRLGRNGVLAFGIVFLTIADVTVGSAMRPDL
jgi:MFS family permease